MKRVILLLTICLGVFACGNSNAKGNKTAEKKAEKDRVEVLYFHGKQRCATCLAIEKNAKAAVEAAFADEMKNGTVVFKTIDLSKSENEAIADKYEVTWSSLFITKWKGGKESKENLTEYAFANARTAPDTFKEGLVKKIKEMQK